MTLVLAVTFLALSLLFVTILWIVHRRLFSRRSKMEKRLNDFTEEKKENKSSEVSSIVKSDKLSEIPLFDRMLGKLNVSVRLQRLLMQADSKMKVGDLVMRMIIFALVGGLLCLVFHQFILRVVLIFGMGAIPLVQVVLQRKNRMDAFAREFPDALDMMTSAIKAGHALNQAIQLVGNEAPEPVSIEFKRTFEQYNLGINLKDALHKLTERVESLDLKLFVTALLLQRETGGNLAEILEKLSYTIRERFKLIGKMRTYTAQGRMSAWLLGTLPIVFVTIISLLNPDYLEPLLNEKLGHTMIFLAVIFQIIGFSIIRKIVQMKF